MLSVDDDELIGEGAQCLGATGGAVDGAAEASGGARFAREDDFALAAQIEDGGGTHIGGDRRASDRSVTAQTEIERTQEQGLPGPGLPRQHVEARPELQSSILDHS